MTAQLYSIRPGRRSDIPFARDIYLASFHGESLLDILFPTRHDHPDAFSAHLDRLFVERWWTPNYDITVCVDADDRPVGFTWWKRPDSQLSAWERWFSPYACLARLIRPLLSLRAWLLPLPNLDPHAAAIFTRVLAQIEPAVMHSARRRAAWYLSTLAVLPRHQGRGLGARLLQHGLRAVDDVGGGGAAAWLIGLAGLDVFYGRYGFREVARANVGELGHWDGGLIMFRE